MAGAEAARRARRAETPSSPSSHPSCGDTSPAARAAFEAYWSSANVTRIHGTWYDVGTLSHPGGPIALSLGLRRDATVLFESHHPFTPRDALRGMLARHEAPPDAQAFLDGKYAPAVRATPYDFDFSHAASSLRGAGAVSAAAAAAGMASGARSGSNDSDGESTDSQASSQSIKSSGGNSRASGGPGGPATAGSAASTRLLPPPPAMDAFEAEVKGIARAYFEGEARRRGVSLREATKAPPARWAQLAVCAAAFVAFGVLPLVSGWWPALLVCPSLGWVWMVNHWHDAAHFAMSTNWMVNAGAWPAAGEVTGVRSPRCPSLRRRRLTVRSPRVLPFPPLPSAPPPTPSTSLQASRTCRPGSLRRSCGTTST
jgi:hypothetical protein